MSPHLLVCEYSNTVPGTLTAERWCSDCGAGVWVSASMLVHVDSGRAIAADLTARLPEWLRTRPDGQLTRRRLPAPETLRKHYRTSWAVVVEALGLLVERGLLERLPATGRKDPDYLPIPPA